MPLLIVSGGPSIGKTTIVNRVVDYFKEHGYANIHVIKDDQALNFSRAHYNDSHKVFLLYCALGCYAELSRSEPENA